MVTKLSLAWAIVLATLAAPAAADVCICYLFPISEMGDLQVYLARYHDPCDNIPIDCAESYLAYAIGPPGIMWQECDSEECYVEPAAIAKTPPTADGEMTIDPDSIGLTEPYPNDYDGRDLKNSPEVTIHQLNDITFKNQTGEVMRARMFEIELECGISKRIALEVEPGCCRPTIYVGSLQRWKDLPRMYTFKLDGEDLLVIASR